MFIQTEATPNPATLKFLPGKVVLESGTVDYRAVDEASNSPLAQKLFAIHGVEGEQIAAGALVLEIEPAAQ